jgi:hypothetical protein
MNFLFLMRSRLGILLSLPCLCHGFLASAAGMPNFERDITTKGEKILKSATKLRKPKNLNDNDHESESNDARATMGLSIGAGSGATYGNGIALNIDPWKYLRAQMGVGYNSTGFKTGLGGAALLPFGGRFAIDVGAAYVHSFGTKEEVSLPAKFTAESGTSTESIKAIRKFRMTPGNYYSVFVGPSFALLPQLLIEAHVNYNKVVSGHVIDFYDGVSYDRPIEASNEDVVQGEFEKKARDKLAVGGMGFSLGAQLRF